MWDGPVTPDERRRHMELLAADAKWGTTGLVLTDLSTVSPLSSPSPEELLDAAALFLDLLASRARNARWAVVASDLFDPARRFGAYIEEGVRRMIVFNEIFTACTWLGVDAGVVTEVVDDLRRELRRAHA